MTYCYWLKYHSVFLLYQFFIHISQFQKFGYEIRDILQECCNKMCHGIKLLENRSQGRTNKFLTSTRVTRIPLPFLSLTNNKPMTSNGSHCCKHFLTVIQHSHVTFKLVMLLPKLRLKLRKSQPRPLNGIANCQISRGKENSKRNATFNKIKELGMNATKNNQQT